MIVGPTPSLDEIVVDLDVGPAAPTTAAGQGHAPSKEAQAEVMQMFREVNGEPAAGRAPSKEKIAEIAAELE